MGGGGDKHPPIPDWRSFKVEDAPELVRVQRMLAAHGLKDPWLRNEVWRFDRKQYGSIPQRFRKFFFRGFKYGLVLAVAHVIVKKLVSSDDHDEHHH